MKFTWIFLGYWKDMNHQSSLLERLSPRPKPCPLVRLGHHNSSSDDTNNSTDGGEKYQPYHYEQCSRESELIFNDRSIGSSYLQMQRQHGSSEESDYVVNNLLKHIFKVNL